MKMWHVTAHVVSQLMKSTAQAAGGAGRGMDVEGQTETGKRKKGKQKTTLGNEKIYT